MPFVANFMVDLVPCLGARPECNLRLDLILGGPPGIVNFKRKFAEDFFAGMRDCEAGSREVPRLAIDKLTKKYNDVMGIIISDVPKEIFKKYQENKKIKFLGLIPQEKLFNEIYPSSDIFLYPSFSD